MGIATALNVVGALSLLWAFLAAANGFMEGASHGNYSDPATAGVSAVVGIALMGSTVISLLNRIAFEVKR